MMPLATTPVMSLMEASCATDIGLALTAPYFADHKTAIKDTTPAIRKQVTRCALKGGKERSVFTVSL